MIAIPMMTLNSFVPENEILSLLKGIKPFDDMEYLHIQNAISWVESGVTIYRLQKPAFPPKHLVSYFVVFDEHAKKILLVDHKKANLWIPTGGHVEPNEAPKTTVERECLEEIFIQADFWREEPLFFTITAITEPNFRHLDATFWYVLKGKSTDQYQFDQKEFRSIRWFGFDEIPYEQSDPHMKRFVDKLKS